MDPVTFTVVPGLLGGIVLALVLFRLHRQHHTNLTPADARRTQPLSTDVINMSSIKVAGIGGLGLVAMAAVVALGVPQIRRSIAIALVLGAALALILIIRRRAKGPMPSSGQRPGANTTLSIDEPEPVSTERNAFGSHTQDLDATAHPA